MMSITHSGLTMTDTTSDPRVDAYIEALPEWQQTICRTREHPLCTVPLNNQP
jgi:hypothetical protein